MDTIEDKLSVILGFRVKDKQVQSLETRTNEFNKDVPKGVRPATSEEISMWEVLKAQLS